MSAVWYRARAELRHRWVATLALIVFMALPAGVVLGCVAGARRGGDALPEFLAYNRASDVLVFVDGSPEQARRLRGEIADLPQWESVRQGGAVVLSVRPSADWLVTVAMAQADAGRGTQDRPLVVEGRIPDPAAYDEVAINEAFARGAGLHAGDTLPLRTIPPSSLEAVANGHGDPYDPDGETVEATVTGIVREPGDLRRAADRTSDTYLPDSWHLALGPAFVGRFGDELATYGYAVIGRVHPGQADALSAAARDIGGDQINVAPGNENAEELAAIDRGIDFETNALYVFALLAGVTTVVLLGQAMARQAHLDLDGDGALRASGLTRRERAAVPVVRTAAIVAVGALGAALVAVALSPVFPVGLARRAELHTGIDADWWLVVGGAAALALVLTGWTMGVAWRSTRPDGSAHLASARSSGSVSSLFAAAGAPVTTVTGVRLALERGRGRTAVPVIGAAVATTAGVLVLCAVLVFGASLDHLVATPALQGWTWDVTAGNFDAPASARQGAQALRADDQVESFVGFGSGPMLVDGHDTYGAFFGPGDLRTATTVLDGRLPTGDDEVAFAEGTLADLGRSVGDEVTVQAGPDVPSKPFRIVGTVVPPAAMDAQLTLSTGAVFTLDGGRRAYPAGGAIPQSYLVRFTDGTTRAEGIASLRDAFGDAVAVPQPAADVVNLSRVQRLPRILAGLVALLALGTLANALVTSVRRHRRDLATFATLGFRRRQLAATVAWQATTFALLALVVGIPLGIALGRTVWRIIMDSIGTVVAPTVPVVMLVGVAAATLVAANLIAALPARAAANTRPAQALRSE